MCLDPGTRCIVDEAGLCVATESNPEFCTGDNCVCSDDNGCIQTVIVGDKNFIIVIFVSLIILFRKLICFTVLILPLEHFFFILISSMIYQLRWRITV